MITRVKDVKATVLGGGIYDLKKAYDELTIEGIKENGSGSRKREKLYSLLWSN